MSTLFDVLKAHQENRNNHKRDRRTFGLVLQGGGMRAVYSAGAMATLVESELGNAFDHVVGASAGALNGAYYLANDLETLHHVYEDDLTNKNFVNILRKEKKVDIDYLVDMVMRHKRPINIAKLLKSSTKLHIVLTDAKNGKKVVISDHKKFAEIYEEFRGTAALPFLYDKPVLVQNRYYIDGGVADNLPLDVALKLGCTDIVVVMTKRIESYTFDRHHQRLIKHLIRRLSSDEPKGLQKVLPTNERLLKLNLGRLSRPMKKRRIYLIQPSDESALVSLGSIDKPKVEALGKLGVTDMDQALHSELAA
jgi:predicted patatin/cPLA2 family phospholipase